MHFEHIRLLWLLCIIPVMVAVFLLRQRHKRKLLEQFANATMMHRLQPDASCRRPAIKLAMLCIATAFLIVAWANPLAGSSISEGEQRGIDMAICIDVSNSMLAQDMKPNRMERSKQVVQNLMSQLGGDRVSLVVFAGRAFIEMPLTNDYSATKMFLDQTGTDLINEQGTAIGDAIDKGMATLGYSEENDDNTPAWEPNKSRAIIIISDGENHEDDAIEAAKKAAKEDIMVCTIGIGSTSGSQIPVTDRRGKIIDWRRDNSGNIITTHLNEEMLRDVAKAGNGIYVHAGNGNAAVQDIVKKLSSLDSQKFGAQKFSSYKSQFQYPLAAGLLFLILEFFILERRNPRINFNKMISRKKSGTLMFILLALLMPVTAMSQNETKKSSPVNTYQNEKKSIPYKVKHRVEKQRRVSTRKGNKELKKNNISSAVTRYRKALAADSNYSKAQYNVAFAHSKLNQNDTSLSYYKKVCDNPSSTREQRSNAHYNAGNIHLRQALAARDTGGYDPNNLMAAIEEYKSSLRLDSKNSDAQHNLSIAKQLLRPSQQNGGGNQDQNKDQNQNKDQQKQNQNQQNQDQNQQQQQDQQQQQQQNKQQQQQDKKEQEQKRREAEQMLNAMKNNEQQTMKEVRMKEANRERRKGDPHRIEKDW